MENVKKEVYHAYWRLSDAYFCIQKTLSEILKHFYDFEEFLPGREGGTAAGGEMGRNQHVKYLLSLMETLQDSTPCL